MAEDGIRWKAHARVDKYSLEQVQWAAAKTGIAEPEGAVLATLFDEPENGVAEADGNLLVTVGLNNLTEVMTGTGISLIQTHTILGVGASTANDASVSDTALTDDNTVNAWYQQVDSGTNPAQSAASFVATATFTNSNANFYWYEWCIAVTTGTITAGDHLSAMASPSPTMINHKMYESGSSLGDKVSGSWVLQATITFS